MAYGIFVQLNVTPVPRGILMRVHRPDGSSFVKRMTKVETPGPYFHPLVATFITGAARLMLALAEYRVIAAGLDWAFCDTDSIAIAKPAATMHAAAAPRCGARCGTIYNDVLAPITGVKLTAN